MCFRYVFQIKESRVFLIPFDYESGEIWCSALVSLVIYHIAGIQGSTGDGGEGERGGQQGPCLKGGKSG